MFVSLLHRLAVSAMWEERAFMLSPAVLERRDCAGVHLVRYMERLPIVPTTESMRASCLTTV
jgi:hypothetical protein